MEIVAVPYLYDASYYSYSPYDNPLGGGGSDRVIRGGCWNSVTSELRSARRSYNPPGGRYAIVGFRLVARP